MKPGTESTVIPTTAHGIWIIFHRFKLIITTHITLPNQVSDERTN
jgi:hypothetical protein